MSEHRELRATAGVFGTPKEEFDIASGYHRQVVRLKDENERLGEQVRQMEEALQRIHREAFSNLSAPKALKQRALTRIMAKAESLVETPNFGEGLHGLEAGDSTHPEQESAAKDSS